MVRALGVVATVVVLAAAGCTDDAPPASDASEVVARIGEDVALRPVTDDDFILSQLLVLGELEQVTDADVIEARLHADDVNEESFLIVLERDGGFDEAAVDELVRLGEDLSVGQTFEPVDELDDTFASGCCVTRVLGEVVVVAGGGAGELKAAVLALE